ncbi:MAG: PQQ-binding-like beta-propeller repeat protein [Acidobacteria bacterium]|nr:PQQ-binding-like beta-propeller repeat protein [Acidobacteriota bacterium]
MRSLIVLFVFVGDFAWANDAQWRGPNRDGHYTVANLLTEWPDTGPDLLWRYENLDPGYGTVTVTDSQIFAVGTRSQKEILTAMDLSGMVVWTLELGPSYEGDFPLARCTPTVVGGSVFVITSAGTVVRADAKSGAAIWSVDAYARYKGSWGIWGTSENLLVIDGKVIYTPGGDQTTMVAMSLENGETVWQTPSLKDKSAYASPAVFEHGGRTVITNVSANYIFGVDLANGELLWHYSYGTLEAPPVEWGAPYVNTITPVYREGHVYTTSGYNHVGAQFKLGSDGKSISVAWTDATLDTHHGGVVLVGDHIYGANWINNRNGKWCAINWQTGKPAYETAWQTKGSIIAVNDFLICYEEKNGHVALVKADPSEFKPVSTFQVKLGDGPHWSHPVVAGDNLYIRHGKALMVYRIAQ